MMTQAIMQAAIETMKAVAKAMIEAAGLTRRSKGAVVATSMKTRLSGLILKQPTFDWKPQDKYKELLYLEIEVKNIL